jgi:predicted RNA-binding protein with PUA domain
MCRICKIDYPQTPDFYTTLHGKIRTYKCRSCHAKLLRDRYEEKKKQGFRLRLVKPADEASVKEATAEAQIKEETAEAQIKEESQ